MRPAEPVPFAEQPAFVRAIRAASTPLGVVLAASAAAAWALLQLRDLTVLRAPAPLAWLALVAAFGIGLALARRPTMRSDASAGGVVALVAAGLVAAVASAIAERLAVHAPSALAAVAGAGVAAAVAAGVIAGRGHARSIAILLVAIVAASWLILDYGYLAGGSGHLYDLGVYLGGGQRFTTGGDPYLAATLDRLPPTAAQDAFLYPPVLLPLFGLLAGLPRLAVDAAWVALLLLAGLAAFRALGLGWGWSLLLLAYPPLVKGVESGNVANLTFLLFALAARRGEGLVAGGLFKVQTAIPALWLVRERRWRPLLAGLALVAALVVLTLPLVGIGSWTGWLAGLQHRAASQARLPVLFGVSLAGVLPGPAFVAVSAAAVMAALALPGRRGLAGLGLATIVASPTLWPHGFLFAVPALLLWPSATVVWLGLAVGATQSLGYWLPVALGALALL
ncbi:MAG TPA: glycosyltransferase 87 family protein, partial [Candidatus Limnocylindrales bacterium]